MKNLNRVIRVQDSMTKIYLMRTLLEQAYPEIVGNRPECVNDVFELFQKMNWLQEQGEIAFKQAVEQLRAADPPQR